MKILLAEDQPLPREAIQKTLESAGFSVTAVEDGKKALEQLSKVEPDLVLSDIRMPTMTGIQLLEAIKAKRRVPVILMTAFSDSCDAPEAYKLGAAGFLAKPFRRDELLQMINGVLGVLPKGGPQVAPNAPSPDDFTKVSVEDFVCGSEILCDIYIRLSDNKFIKIAHQGEDLDRARIEAYKKKGVFFLFMKKLDYAKYLGFTIHISKVAVNSPAVAKEKKLAVVRHTGEILSQQLHLEVIDKELYINTKAFLEMSISLLSEDDSLLNLLSSLHGHSEYLYSHSMAVSMMSVMIARAVGWTSQPTLFKLAMGGMFHDIGKKGLDPQLVGKVRKDLTPAETKLLEDHSTKGLEIVNEIKSIPGDVVQIVYQHHENCLGQGTPRGLTHKHIHPMARLVAVADEFCNLIHKGNPEDQMTPKEAIHRIQESGAGRFDANFLAALKGLFIH